ncbi:hypothetical protein AB0I06_00770 [Streptomyces sp. NPDC050674]|uniref:hypothetical protein n=1 Tax=Streptomyces sp. NPDC050674 TaxID=3157216 RepID=UPI003430E76C
MTEDLPARAVRGDIEAIQDLLFRRHLAGYGRPEEREAVEGVTLEAAQTWLDAAQARRPRSSRHEERDFAFQLGRAAGHLVQLAGQTGESWNRLLAHPVFAAPVITASDEFPPPVPPVRQMPEPSDGRGGPSYGGALPDEALAAMGFAVAVGLVPFLQTIAAQAGQRTFDIARATIRASLPSGRGGRIAGPHLVVEERDGRVEIRMPSDIPDAALHALVALGDQGIEALAEPDPRGRIVTVTWNAQDGRWERVVHRRA